MVTKATYCLVLPAWYKRCARRSIALKNTSIPLFFHSCRPAIQSIIASSGTTPPNCCPATRLKASRAALRRAAKALPLGTKSGSKPFGVTISTGLSNSCLHSLAVMSLTVVKQSAQWAACFSTECLLTIFSSAAI